MEIFADNLYFTAACAEEEIGVLIEPFNAEDVPGYLIGHMVQAKSVIDVVGHDNLLLQYDLYHGAMNGEDLLAAIEENLDRIPHMQVAGATGCHEPEDGDIDYGALFEAIEELGYGGWISCEYRPRAGTVGGWAGPRLTGSGRGLYRSSQALTSWHCLPRPSTPKRMTSPGLRKIGGSWPRPTPGGVPVAMMSPGNRVI